MLARRRCRGHAGSSWQEPVHEGVETLIGLLLAFVGEVEGGYGGFKLGMAQVAVDKAGGHARCEPMGGVGMSQGMDSHTCFGQAGALCGFAEGALHTGATHGGGRCGTVGVIAPRGGKATRFTTIGFTKPETLREGS